MNNHHESIKSERQSVYGEPYQNHVNIGKMWGALLQPFAQDIHHGKDVPPELVARMMVALKFSRMPRAFHEDNYDDGSIYLEFDREFAERSRCADDRFARADRGLRVPVEDEMSRGNLSGATDTKQHSGNGCESGVALSGDQLSRRRELLGGHVPVLTSGDVFDPGSVQLGRTSP